MAIAESIRQTIAGLNVPHKDSETGILTVSLGVATAAPPVEGEVAGLIEAGDAALYQTKKAGRNRVEAAGG